jgi:hypothetical protein
VRDLGVVESHVVVDADANQIVETKAHFPERTGDSGDGCACPGLGILCRQRVGANPREVVDASTRSMTATDHLRGLTIP